MKITKRQLAITAICILLYGTCFSASAEALEHHGKNVDATGTKEPCVSCHNAYDTPTNFKCMPICLFRKSHPHKIAYPTEGKPNKLKPAYMLAQQGIVLPDGNLDCVSCHNLTSTQPFHLTFKNSPNGICVSCHIK